LAKGAGYWRRQCRKEAEGKSTEGAILPWRHWSKPFHQGHHGTRVGFLSIHDAFYQYLSTIPKTIVMKTNTGCSWRVKLKDVNNKIFMDQGWEGFSIAHDIKIGYFMTFKELKRNV
jgi:hypothetical protein